MISWDFHQWGIPNSWLCIRENHTPKYGWWKLGVPQLDSGFTSLLGHLLQVTYIYLLYIYCCPMLPLVLWLSSHRSASHSALEVRTSRAAPRPAPAAIRWIWCWATPPLRCGGPGSGGEGEGWLSWAKRWWCSLMFIDVYEKTWYNMLKHQ